MRFVLVPSIAIHAVIFAFATTLCAQTDSLLISISPRVGFIIDNYERRYFNLFPTVQKFSSANVRQITSDSIVISITRTLSSDTSVSIRADQLDVFKHYIDQQETFSGTLTDYYESAENTALRNLIQRRILEPKVWKVQNPKLVEIVKRDRKRFLCRILFASDSSLVFSKDLSDEPKDTLLSFLSVNSVDSVRSFYRKFNPFHTALIAISPLVVYILAARLSAYTKPAEKSGQSVLQVITAGLIFAIASPFYNAILVPLISSSFKIAIHGNSGVYEQNRDFIRSISKYPDLPPPEVMRLVEHEDGSK